MLFLGPGGTELAERSVGSPESMFGPDAAVQTVVPENTKSSHPGPLLRGNLRQVRLGLADCAMVGGTATLATVLAQRSSMRCRVHSIDQDAAGWGHPTAAQVDGWMRMHCDFILGARGFGHCIIPGSQGPIPGPLCPVIGRQRPCMSCRSGAALPTAVRRPGPLKYVTWPVGAMYSTVAHCRVRGLVSQAPDLIEGQPPLYCGIPDRGMAYLG